jgi:serine/threonine protein kinase
MSVDSNDKQDYTRLTSLKMEIQKDIKFLNKEEFDIKYPFDESNKIAGGAYGAIYSVKNKPTIIVKKGDLDSILRDIDILSLVKHPHIIKILDVCLVSNKECFIVFPKGLDLTTYIDDKIKDKNYPMIRKSLMYGLACGLAFLHDAGVVHGDIKPQNIIVINDNAIFIDFGLSKVCIPIQGELIFKGAAHTAGYAEPEFLEPNYNSITGDVYALGKVFEYLMDKQHHYSSLPVVFPHEDLFNDLIKHMVCERKYRLSAQGVLSHLFFKQFDVSEITFNPCKGNKYNPIQEPKENSPQKLNDIVVGSLMLGHYYTGILNLLKIIEQYPVFHLRTLFLTLHNIHRSLDIMVNYQVQKFTLLIMVNLYLAAKELESTTYIIEDYLKIFGNLFNGDDFFKMSKDVLERLNGVVYTYTYWDYCQHPNDLSKLLEDTIDYQYHMNLEGKNLYVKNYKDSIALINYPSSLKEKIILGNNFVKAWKKLHSITHLEILFKLIQDNHNPMHERKFLTIISPDDTEGNNKVKYESINSISIEAIWKKLEDRFRNTASSLFPYNLGYVYALRNDMRDNLEVSNFILDEIINNLHPDYILIFDVVYEYNQEPGTGKEKLLTLLDYRRNVFRTNHFDIKRLKKNIFSLSLIEFRKYIQEMKKKVGYVDSGKPVVISTSSPKTIVLPSEVNLIKNFDNSNRNPLQSPSVQNISYTDKNPFQSPSIVPISGNNKTRPSLPLPSGLL